MVANGLFSSAYDKSICAIFTLLTWIVMFRFRLFADVDGI